MTAHASATGGPANSPQMILAMAQSTATATSAAGVRVVEEHGRTRTPRI